MCEYGSMWQRKPIDVAESTVGGGVDGAVLAYDAARPDRDAAARGALGGIGRGILQVRRVLRARPYRAERVYPAARADLDAPARDAAVVYARAAARLDAPFDYAAAAIGLGRLAKMQGSARGAAATPISARRCSPARACGCPRRTLRGRQLVLYTVSAGGEPPDDALIQRPHAAGIGPAACYPVPMRYMPCYDAALRRPRTRLPPRRCGARGAFAAGATGRGGRVDEGA